VKVKNPNSPAVLRIQDGRRGARRIDHPRALPGSVFGPEFDDGVSRFGLVRCQTRQIGIHRSNLQDLQPSPPEFPPE
jgi:hypothetical protein